MGKGQLEQDPGYVVQTFVTIQHSSTTERPNCVAVVPTQCTQRTDWFELVRAEAWDPVLSQPGVPVEQNGNQGGLLRPLVW